MDRWEKQRWEGSERTRKEVRRSKKRKNEKKDAAGARKGRKVPIQSGLPLPRVSWSPGFVDTTLVLDQ